MLQGRQGFFGNQGIIKNVPSLDEGKLATRNKIGHERPESTHQNFGDDFIAKIV